MGSAVRQLRCVVCQTPYAGNERFCPIDGGAIIATASGEAEADGYVGKTIDGRYLVRRLIGKGGMGAVYEADHVGLDRRVALKLMLGKIDADALARFRREARAASKVVHGNVVQIFDVGTDDDNLDYIVMEFLDGEDLDTVISTAAFKAGGGFSTARAVKIAVQLLRGLAAIHAAGIVHRDIKPANVLLLDGDVVKLTDFGIAKSTDTTATALTDTGRVIGTVKYMSPEQLSGQPPDPRSDLYAAGLVLYEILVGKAPFESDASAELAAMHFSAPAPSLAVKRADASPELVAALDRVLAKDPGARFADANAFILALEAAPVSDDAPEPIDESPQVTRPASQRRGDKVPSSEQPTKANKTTGGDNARAPDAVTAAVRSARGPRYLVWAGLAIVVGISIALVVRRATRGEEQPAAPSIASPLPAGGSGRAVSEIDARIAEARAADDAGRLELAIANYRAAYEIEKRPVLLYRIGDLQERVGRKTEAAATFAQYLAAAPDAPDAVAVKARIAMLAPVGAEDSSPPPKGPRKEDKPSYAATITLPHARTGCVCLPNTGDMLNEALCATPSNSFMCKCIVAKTMNSVLCTKVVNGECAHDWGGYALPGKPGEKCRGQLSMLDPTMLDGDLECLMTCSVDTWFVGPGNAPCVGWDDHSGTQRVGHTQCDMADADVKSPSPEIRAKSKPNVAPSTSGPSKSDAVLLGGAKLAPGQRGCLCHPNDGEKGGSMGLCPKLSGHHQCSCRSDDGQGGGLCPVAFSADGCAVPTSGIDATPGAACSGRGQSDGPVMPGHYDCDAVCAVDKFSYVGHEGQACRGYVTWSGDLLDGSLDCEGVHFH